MLALSPLKEHIIDLYKLGDNSEDLKISKERARIKSCDISSEKDCRRCESVCPLRVMDFEI